MAQFANSDMAPEASFDTAITLKVRTDVDGLEGEVKVVNAEGPAGFENAVNDAISGMKFKPTKHDGENVPVWSTLEIRYLQSAMRTAIFHIEKSHLSRNGFQKQ